MIETAIEVVDKTAASDRDVFARCGDGPDRSLMVGNSLKPDVIPAIEAGGWGVDAPHEPAFALEHAEPPAGHPRDREIAGLAALPQLIDSLRMVR